MATVFTCEEVTKAYGGLVAVKDLTFEVEEGEKVTLSSLDGSGSYGLPRRPTHGSRARVPFFAGGVNHAVHPGTELPVARIRWKTGVFVEKFPDVLRDGRRRVVD